MELRIYSMDDDSIKRRGVLENFSSLIWTRKFYEPGSFELHAPLTDDNIALLKKDRIIAKDGSIESGIIESLEYDDNDSKKIIASGRFLSSICDRRLIQSTYTFNGKVEVAMRNLINYVNAIPHMTLGDLNGFSETITFQATMKNLLTILEKLSSTSNIGFRVKLDVTNNSLIFDTYMGLDRSLDQSTNKRVIFSEDYGNLTETVYTLNGQLEKTYAVVGGEGEGSARTYVRVGGGTGLNLKEIFVDAKDLRSEDFGSTSEYQEALKQKGLESLATNALVESFEFGTNATGQFNYLTDYDLGDIVTIWKRKWNVRENKRITEIQEVYEDGGLTVTPTLGDPLPDTVDWSDE